MNWEPPEVIRRRGQRRTAMRRAAVLAGSFVAVALIAVGATLYLTRPTAAPISPGASVPTSPPTTGIFKTPHSTSGTITFTLSPLPRLTADLMLQPADVPGATLNDEPQAGYDGTLAPMVDRCGQAPLILLTYAWRDRAFQYPDGRNLYQVVNEYATAADAAHALDWYRGEVAACPSFDPNGGARILTMPIQDFAGDESIAVQDNAPGGTDLHVFVRVGNRLTDIVLNPGDATLGKQLGQRASTHL
jgi:hypothetical protein